MKKFIALIFASSLFLAGCNTVTAPSTTPTTPTWTDVQSAVVSACGFLPTVTTIASIVSANPAVSTGSQIAALICKAVTPSKLAAKRLKAGQEIAPKIIVLNNKVIEINGQFVK